LKIPYGWIILPPPNKKGYFALVNNAGFLEKAFRDLSPKMVFGFSRPIYHNFAGVFFGHRFNKSENGGMIRHTEGAMLYLWASRLAPGSTVLEIGCYGGLSTSYLAAGCQKSRSKVFSIDPFDSEMDKQARLSDQAVSLENKPSREEVAARLRARGLDASVELNQGFAEEFVRHWSRPIHFLWIDGNHNRARQDYLDWSPFLAPRARVAFHDAHPRYGLPHVAEAVREIFSTDEWRDLEHVKGILTAVRKR
jgi:predicted O-methyltransferase YrrM